MMFWAFSRILQLLFLVIKERSCFDVVGLVLSLRCFEKSLLSLSLELHWYVTCIFSFGFSMKLLFFDDYHWVDCSALNLQCGWLVFFVLLVFCSLFLSSRKSSPFGHFWGGFFSIFGGLLSCTSFRRWHMFLYYILFCTSNSNWTITEYVT